MSAFLLERVPARHQACAPFTVWTWARAAGARRARRKSLPALISPQPAL